MTIIVMKSHLRGTKLPGGGKENERESKTKSNKKKPEQPLQVNLAPKEKRERKKSWRLGRGNIRGGWKASVATRICSRLGTSKG